MTDAVYIIALTPDAPVRVRDLFHIGPEFVSQVLERPPVLREYGWDLRTLDQAHIVGGEYLELRNGPRKTLQLYEDGTLVARGVIDADFLAWGRTEKTLADDPRVHTLAIIEFTTAFVSTYRDIIKFLDKKPTALRYHIEIANGKIGDRFLYIVPWPVNSLGWLVPRELHALTDPNPQADGVIDANEVLIDPAAAALQIVERLFLFFGVASNSVPYTVVEDGRRRIDVKKIADT